jgi:hypothetical protein
MANQEPSTPPKLKIPLRIVDDIESLREFLAAADIDPAAVDFLFLLPPATHQLRFTDGPAIGLNRHAGGFRYGITVSAGRTAVAVNSFEFRAVPDLPDLLERGVLAFP